MLKTTMMDLALRWDMCPYCQGQFSRRKGLMERHQKTLYCQAMFAMRERTRAGYERIGNGGLATQIKNAGIEIVRDYVNYYPGFSKRRASAPIGPWVKKEIMDLYRARTQSAHAKARWLTLARKKETP